MTHPSTRILVLGAGIAGLLFTLRLSGKVKNSSVQITLVDESDTFMVRPRLHEFATNQHVSQRSLPKILRASRVQFVQGRVISLHPSQRSVTVLDQQQQPHELEYDYLVYALGSMTDRHSVAGVADYAYSLSASGPLSAAALRDRLPALAERSGQVVVCGGGATGIETAAQVASIYPHLKVSLLTQGSLASSLGPRVAEAIRRRLVSLGVEIVEHSKVSAVRAHSVVLEQGRELACDLCIWTAGFVVQPFATIMHPEALALLRTIIADAHRFPQLTETLRSTIHERAAVEVSLLLERARINGVALRQGDTMLMTRLFVGSLMTYVMFDGLLHPQGEPALPDAGQIEAMVTLFLSAIVDPRELERNQ